MDAVAQSCATNTNLCPIGGRKLWAIHNFMMWWAWVFLLAISICSARYFRHYWRKSIYIHTISGTTISIITFVAIWMAWIRIYRESGYQFMAVWNVWSNLFEMVATFYAYLLFLSGGLAWFYRRYG